MTIEFTPGDKYRNRRGEYELLEVTPDGRLKVRYLSDGLVAELDRAQQERIIQNILLEEQVAANAPKVPIKPATPTRSSVAEPKVPAHKPPTPARPVQNTSVARPAKPKTSSGSTTLRDETRVTLQPSVPVRTSFTKLEILRLLQFIGYGRPDGTFWFIGGGEAFMDNGNALISERVANEDFHKDFVDAAVYKPRFLEEGGYLYGSPIWKAANYLATRILLSPEEQTEENRRRYFSEKFGAPEGDVLLADLISLPANVPTPNIQAVNWPYRSLTITDSPLYNRTLRDPQLFLEDKFTGWDTRIERLRDLYEDMKAKKSAPRYVFCQGKLSFGTLFKELFPKVTSYTPLDIPAFADKDKPVRTAIGRDNENGTLIILTPPFLPSEGVTTYYLDRLIEFCITLASRK